MIDEEFNQPWWNIVHYMNLPKKYSQDVGDFLRSQFPSRALQDRYSNDLRHQYVSAVVARNLGENTAIRLGNIMEAIDYVSAPGDSRIDQINNEIGRRYAKKYPTLEKSAFLNKLFEDHEKNVQYRNSRLK